MYGATRWTEEMLPLVIDMLDRSATKVTMLTQAFELPG